MQTPVIKTTLESDSSTTFSGQNTATLEGANGGGVGGENGGHALANLLDNVENCIWHAFDFLALEGDGTAPKLKLKVRQKNSY